MANIIYVGSMVHPLFTFTDEEISDINMETEVDLVGEELSTDVMEVEVFYDDADHNLRNTPWAMAVYYCSESELIGKFFLTKVTRTGREKYKLFTTSAAGILSYETFYGGMYSGVAFHTVAEQILGTNGLMPYKGFYTKCTREVVGTSAYSNMRGVGLGKYYNQNKTSTTGTRPFWTATMSSKMHAKFTLHGFLGSLRTDSGATSATSLRLSLLGCHALSGAASSVSKYSYGMYMDVSRASTAAAWPSFGPVYFVYGSTAISLGTPSDSITYEIDVDPVAGKATINGVDYSISIPSGTSNSATALHVYGGGVILSDGGSSIGVAANYNANGDCISADYEYYKISAQNGDVQCDAVTLVDIYNGNITFFDLANFTYPATTPYHVSVDEYDLAVYEGTYGDYPLFDDQTLFQWEVLNNIRFAYEVRDIPVYGWIPICSKREALHQLLFSQGVLLFKDQNGALLFTPPIESVAGEISQDLIYNEGYTEYMENTNVLELSEHSWIYDSGMSAVSVFDNMGSVTEGYFIAPFSSAPIYGNVTASGLQIIYRNCNAAVASGIGSISAVPYKHSEVTMKRTIAAYPDGRDIAVTDATLVTAQNSAMILDRMEAYYGYAYKVKVDLVSSGERCGAKYAFTSAFNEALIGFLGKASRTVTKIVRAACEFILGYSPPPINAGYHNYVVLSGSGIWDVPADVFTAQRPRIRVVLIGGGQGGASGYAGEKGKVPSEPYFSQYLSAAALGGNPGQPGSPGRVLEFEIENPAQSYSYACGAGGAGGAESSSHSSNNAGSNGGATTITDGTNSYTSANGVIPDSGYVNPFNGDAFAKVFTTTGWGTGKIGVGGKGGYVDTYSPGRQAALIGIYYENTDCQMLVPTTRSWTHGSSGTTWIDDGGAGAGGGGGYGSNGSNGGNGKTTGSGRSAKIYGGNGGKGGDATQTPPKATTYNPKYFGYGGHGGGGGGGGGSSGACNNHVAEYSGGQWVEYDITKVNGTPGNGGYGGRGGDGGDGCVIIYY